MIILVLLAVILALGPGSVVWAQAPKEEGDPVKELKDDIAMYLLTSRILKKYESEELAWLLVELEGQTRDIEILKTVSLGVTEKVVKDRGNMLFLLRDLETLYKEKYSSRLVKISEDDLSSCWNGIKALVKDMKKQRPKFNKPDERLNADDYIMIMNKNAVFLTGQGKVRTIADVWNSFEVNLSGVYAAWNKRYTRLLGKVQDNPDSQPEEILTDDEVKFLKVFGRVDWYYRRLTGTLGQ